MGLDDDPLGEITTKQDGSSVPIVSIDAITSLVGSFSNMMVGMEARLSSQIKEWRDDSKEYRRATDAKLVAVETELKTKLGIVEAKIDGHIKKEEREELIADARVVPVKNAASWFAKHWERLLLFAIGILALLGFAGDNLQHFLNMFGVR